MRRRDVLGLKKARRLAVQPVEERGHESVPLAGDALPFGGRYLAADMAQLDQEFPVSRVLARIGERFFHLDGGIVEPRPDFSGEEKSAANAHRADRVQFVGVEEDAGFQRFAADGFPETVGGDAVDDSIDDLGIEPALLQNGLGFAGPGFGVAGLPDSPVLFRPADVVEQGGQTQDVQVGFFLPADPYG